MCGQSCCRRGFQLLKSRNWPCALRFCGGQQPTGRVAPVLKLPPLDAYGEVPLVTFLASDLSAKPGSDDHWRPPFNPPTQANCNPLVPEWCRQIGCTGFFLEGVFGIVGRASCMRPVQFGQRRGSATQAGAGNARIDKVAALAGTACWCNHAWLPSRPRKPTDGARISDDPWARRTVSPTTCSDLCLLGRVSVSSSTRDALKCVGRRGRASFAFTQVTVFCTLG